MKKYIFIGAIFFLIFVSSCDPQKKIAGNYNYKTECLGIELDGSITVKSWGNGRNRLDAVEQAKKNAINDVLFNGINEGKASCQVKPIVLNLNIRRIKWFL